ncbi:HEAT STRESS TRANSCRIPTION FACTOR A-5 [Salix koriyanagi]|uniref:HEAT STRESS TRANSCRIPTION FACTOR A-5 n=1 Tax=Salix koriyanagi TaxID=2511006 RepID=A0A9Q0X1N3_9ROSI|nr:HEAT STRESS TRANSCRIPTION FACTOR A-5 [Salix koriyanagi]
MRKLPYTLSTALQWNKINGFRKIDPERWEFGNEDFVKDQKHLLKNIHRRKPIHSHSQPQGSLVDPERAAYEKEIDKLSRDKAKLQACIQGSEQQRSSAKLQVEDLTRKIDIIQQRQEKLLSFLEKSVQNPTFVEHLARKIEALDFSAYSKKRRLPQVDHSMPIAENTLVENHSSSRPVSNVIHQDFSDKLRLELSPAVSDINLVSHSTQSSNEDGGSPRRKISEGNQKDALTRTSGLQVAPETWELSDTGASYTFKANPALNLSLASSPLQVNTNPYSARIPQLGQEIGKSPESRFNESNKDSDMRATQNNTNQGNEGRTLSSPQENPNNNQAPASAPVTVNDVFWEQFLTERPGYSDNEEASSNYRANPYDERERRIGFGVPRNAKNMEQLSL